MSDLNFQSGATTSTDTPVGDQASQGDPQAASREPSNSDQSFLEYNGKSLSREDVLKKLQNADSFIETLKGERAEDRQRLEAIESQLQKAGKVDEVLEALRGNGQGAPDQENTPPENEPASPTLDVETLTQGVLEQLSAREQAQLEDNNWKAVTETLTHTFGEKTNAKVREVALNNDLSVEEAADLARKRPKVFLKLFGDEVKGSTTSASLLGGGRRPAPRKDTTPSGYAQARKTSDQISIYKKKLADAGLELNI